MPLETVEPWRQPPRDKPNDCPGEGSCCNGVAIIRWCCCKEGKCYRDLKAEDTKDEF